MPKAATATVEPFGGDPSATGAVTGGTGFSGAAVFQMLADRIASFVSPEPAPAPSPQSGDPLAALAAALAAASAASPKSTQEPLADPAPAVDTTPNDPLSQLIYKAAYGLGYGVAFPTFMALSFVPDNALGRGLRDGAASAEETV
ncbi:MAG: hypothetical protein NT069_29440, partial [Planctomycetota bacterium]|nr:hypothetical protein [Planctomycetota bacterium]